MIFKNQCLQTTSLNIVDKRRSNHPKHHQNHKENTGLVSEVVSTAITQTQMPAG